MSHGCTYNKSYGNCLIGITVKMGTYLNCSNFFDQLPIAIRVEGAGPADEMTAGPVCCHSKTSMVECF